MCKKELESLKRKLERIHVEEREIRSKKNKENLKGLSDTFREGNIWISYKEKGEEKNREFILTNNN